MPTTSTHVLLSSVAVIIPYSIGKNRVASSPNSKKIKVFFYKHPSPLSKLLGADKTKQAGGRVLSISQGKIRIWNYLSQKKYETLFTQTIYL